MDQIVEQWRPVVGYEGFYEVSDQGRVRSVDRHILYSNGKTCFWRGRVLRQSPCMGGYMKITLSKGSRLRTLKPHVLVLEAFVGPRPEGMEACHNDGNVTNNRLSNLRWDTPFGNAKDKDRHGTNSKGERHGATALSDIDAINIRKEFEGLGGKKGTAVIIARRYGVAPYTISNIVRRRTWRHV